MQAMPGPSTSPRVLVIVPAWNEQDSVGATVREIRETNPGRGHPRRRRRLRRRAPSSVRSPPARRCAGCPSTSGSGGAMRTGYRYALRHGYDVAVQIDADGQHDPRYLPALIAGLDGRRHRDRRPLRAAGDPYVVRGPRRWAMVMLARVLSRLSHTRLTDVTSGFRASNRRAIAVFASHYPAEYLGDTVESLVIAVRTRLPSDPGARRHAVPVGRPALVLAAAVGRLPGARRGRPRPRPGPAVGGELRRGRHPDVRRDA